MALWTKQGDAHVIAAAIGNFCRVAGHGGRRQQQCVNSGMGPEPGDFIDEFRVLDAEAENSFQLLF